MIVTERECTAISDDTQAIGPSVTPPQPPAGPANGGWVVGGRYRVLERIGSGGMAEVFRARDEVLDRLVAVKVFRAEHVASEVADTNAHGIERQQLEVAALARLNHPNLIALYDGSLDAAPHAYIVMELIEGPSLAARIAEGPLPEASTREIGIQLADGLAYVHAQGMVHRDVKPENILLGVDRSDDDHTVRARLSDFGIVRLLGTERLTSVNFTLGTASYLAPEQARGSAVDPPADIYSLGLVLLEALTGQRTFDGPPLEAALARLSQRPAVPAGLPEPWPGLLHAMTEYDPALRPTAGEVARTLRNEGSRALPLVPIAVPVAAGFAEAPTGMVAVPGAGAPPAAGVPSAAPPPPRRRRPSGMVIAAVLSLLVILTTLGIFLFTGNDSNSPALAPATGRSPAGDTSSAVHRSDKPNSSGPTTPPGGHRVSASATRSTSSFAHTSAAPSTSSRPAHTSSAPSISSSHAPGGGPSTATHTSAPASSSTATTPTVSTSPSTSSPASTQTSAGNSPATSSSPA